MTRVFARSLSRKKIMSNDGKLIGTLKNIRVDFDSGQVIEMIIHPDLCYEHRWTAGQLILWDNRCTMHLAPKDYDHSQLRLMCRTTLIGKPLGYLYGQAPAAAAAPAGAAAGAGGCSS